MNKFIIRQSLLLLLTAFIWGVAFVAQSAAMDSIGPFTFVGLRNVLAGAALLPVIHFLDKQKAKSDTEHSNTSYKWYLDKTVLAAGFVCGLFLCVASLTQQIGIQSASVGKAGFLTALYIIMVPILGIFLRKKAGIKVWIGVVIALVGVYLLCAKGGLSGFETADYLLLLCALFFSLQIMAVDHYVEKVDGVKIACLQFWFCSIVCCVGMIIFERPQMSQIIAAAVPILYAGLMSSAVGYTLQIVGQKGMNPTVASLLMSLESVFSALAGWALLHQVLSQREVMGCILVFVAIILAQLPDKKSCNTDKR